MTTETTASSESTGTIDPMFFREVLGHYPTGIVLITGIADDGEPVGMVIGSFTSVSLDPVMIAFLPTRNSRTFARLRTAKQFCVNVLAANQRDVATLFSRYGEDKFSKVNWHSSPSGAPVIDDAVAAIDCSYHSVLEAGDHYIVLGTVHHLTVLNPVHPLVYFQGGYGRFTPQSIVDYSDSEIIDAVRLAEQGRPEMEALAAATGGEVCAMAPVGSDLSVVAVAVPPGDSAVTPVGRRVPLIPPLAEQFVASNAADLWELWISRANISPEDSEPLERYRRRLAVARERGWSVARAGEPNDDVAAAVREYSLGDRTPAQMRDLGQTILAADQYYETVDIVDGECYDISNMTAAVALPNGPAQLILRVAGLPLRAQGEHVRKWIDQLLTCASAISARLDGADRPAEAVHAAVR